MDLLKQVDESEELTRQVKERAERQLSILLSKNSNTQLEALPDYVTSDTKKDVALNNAVVMMYDLADQVVEQRKGRLVAEEKNEIYDKKIKELTTKYNEQSEYAETKKEIRAITSTTLVNTTNINKEAEAVLLSTFKNLMRKNNVKYEDIDKIGLSRKKKINL